MRQYVHTELNEIGKASVEKVQYAGAEVLLRRVDGVPIVLGFITGEYMKPKQGVSLPLTEVEPIIDVKQRVELTDLLKKDNKKPLIFWNE